MKQLLLVGATGLVGTKMLEVLAERNFPITELIPVASERSIGKLVEYKGKGYKVVSMEDAIAAKPAVAPAAPAASRRSASTSPSASAPARTPASIPRTMRASASIAF